MISPSSSGFFQFLKGFTRCSFVVCCINTTHAISLVILVSMQLIADLAQFASPFFCSPPSLLASPEHSSQNPTQLKEHQVSALCLFPFYLHSFSRDKQSLMDIILSIKNVTSKSPPHYSYNLQAAKAIIYFKQSVAIPCFA